PAAAAASTTSTTFKLLHWNTHHGGRRTDGVNDPQGLVTWIAKFKPDVVSLNEVDNQAQATDLARRLKTKTGVTWGAYYHGRGNLLLSRLAITNRSTCVVNQGVGRKAAHIGVVVHGRAINVWSAHLDVSSASTRVKESKALMACMNGFQQQRIVAGDFNLLP